MKPSAELCELRRVMIRDFPRITKNTTPGDAALLRILIESSRAKRGLEIGVATGYGALVMGLGFERNGGHLTSVEIDPEMVRVARANVKKMHLEHVVRVVKGDALRIISKLEGPFDFVFLDAIKEDYLAYLRAVEPKLKPRAIIVADNVIQFADAMEDFLTAIQDERQYQSVILRASEEKGDGMAVLYKEPRHR